MASLAVRTYYGKRAVHVVIEREPLVCQLEMMAQAKMGPVYLSARAHCTDPRVALDFGAFLVSIREECTATFLKGGCPICVRDRVSLASTILNLYSRSC